MQNTWMVMNKTHTWSSLIVYNHQYDRLTPMILLYYHTHHSHNIHIQERMVTYVPSANTAEANEMPMTRNASIMLHQYSTVQLVNEYCQITSRHVQSRPANTAKSKNQ